MSDQTIFNQNQQETPVNESVQKNTPSFEDLLGMVTNEQGERKYKDVPSALQGLQHAQTFISQLKSEIATLKAENESLKIQAEKIRELENTVQTLSANTRNPQNTEPTEGKLDEATIADLLERTLTKREIEARRQANINKVVVEVKSKFGDKAEEVFYGKAKELGMSVEEVNELASKSPQAVLGLLGITATANEGFKAPTTSGVNTAGYTPPTDSYLKANKGALLGASYHDLVAEKNNATKMVEELAAQGLSISDLTNPKVFFKHFN